MSIWEYLEIIRQTPCVSCFNDPGFGYYETIIIRTRNLWSEYKCILPKTISSSRDNIQEMRYQKGLSYMEDALKLLQLNDFGTEVTNIRGNAFFLKLVFLDENYIFGEEII